MCRRDPAKSGGIAKASWIALIVVGACAAFPEPVVAKTYAGKNVVRAQSPSAYIRLSRGGAIVGRLFSHEPFYILSHDSIQGKAVWGYADGADYKGCGWIGKGRLFHSFDSADARGKAQRCGAPPPFGEPGQSYNRLPRVREYHRIARANWRTWYTGKPHMCRFQLGSKRLCANYTAVSDGGVYGVVNGAGGSTGFLCRGNEIADGDMRLRYVVKRRDGDNWAGVVKVKGHRWAFVELTNAELSAIRNQDSCNARLSEKQVSASVQSASLGASCTSDDSCDLEEHCGPSGYCEECDDDECGDDPCTGSEPDSDPECGWGCSGGCGQAGGNWYTALSTGAAFGPYYSFWRDGHGLGSARQFLADVDGDGRDDAIVYFVSGDWYVSLSEGTRFGNYSLWMSGHGIGSTNQFLADVNGDGRADAVVFFGSGGLAGNWYVATSTGTSFGPYYGQWMSGHGIGSTSQFLGDVNGDGKADAVVFFVSGSLGGNWYVALSTGGSFGPYYGQWMSGHGIGSSKQFLGDVNGDGKADAAVFFGSGGLAGNWYTALSTGGSFGPYYGQWMSGHGIGSSNQFIADVNGDGKADAVVFFGSSGLAGNWYVALSNGGAFGPYYGQWMSGHGIGSTSQLLGNVDGDCAGKADAVVFFGVGEAAGDLAEPIPPPTCTGQTSGIERVSVASGGGQVLANFEHPSISSDGGFVAFVSDAPFVAGDAGGFDTFVHDRETHTTERISVASGGHQGTGDPDDFNVGTPSISATGRYVAFVSVAADLVPGDTNGQRDVFVRDRQAGTTERVSIRTDGGQATSASFGSSSPSISSDGRYVAFASSATDLISGDTNGMSDIFVRDRVAGTTERVNVATGGAQAAGGHSLDPAISSDGRFVAFESTAYNLVSGGTGLRSAVLVRDRQAGTTELVSVPLQSGDGSRGAYFPTISADGRYVAFHSDASHLVDGDANGVSDAFVRDRALGQMQRVSVPAGGESNGGSSQAKISADGRFVAFSSFATNLVPSDTNGFEDIFLFDRQTGTIERVSTTASGDPANSSSELASISGDGALIAFVSGASNLVANDSNGVRDIFVRRR